VVAEMRIETQRCVATPPVLRTVLRGTSGVYRLDAEKWEDYKMGEYIAGGTFGKVYQASVVTPVAGLKAGDRVAIKVLKPESAGASFAAELAAYTAVYKACPDSVPALYESGTSNGAPFVVTELLDGSVMDAVSGKSDQWFKTAGASAKTVEAVWKQMVQAVSCLHQHGVTHADVKPAVRLLLCLFSHSRHFGTSSDRFISGACDVFQPQNFLMKWNGDGVPTIKIAVLPRFLRPRFGIAPCAHRIHLCCSCAGLWHRFFFRPFGQGVVRHSGVRWLLVRSVVAAGRAHRGQLARRRRVGDGLEHDRSVHRQLTAAHEHVANQRRGELCFHHGTASRPAGRPRQIQTGVRALSSRAATVSWSELRAMAGFGLQVFAGQRPILGQDQRAGACQSPASVQRRADRGTVLRPATHCILIASHCCAALCDMQMVRAMIVPAKDVLAPPSFDALAKTPLAPAPIANAKPIKLVMSLKHLAAFDLKLVSMCTARRAGTCSA
jgi:hypothetical protein